MYILSTTRTHIYTERERDLHTADAIRFMYSSVSVGVVLRAGAEHSMMCFSYRSL